jgi:hypothetical protein
MQAEENQRTTNNIPQLQPLMVQAATVYKMTKAAETSLILPLFS